MTYGKLIRWNENRGFGFLRADDSPGERDVFVHVSELRRAGVHFPVEGDRFTYDVEHDAKAGKPQAVRLAPLPRAGARSDLLDSGVATAPPA